MNVVANRLYPVLSRHRRLVALLAYGTVAAVSYALAFVLRFDLQWRSEYTTVFAATLPALLVIRLTLYGAFKLSAGRWRFISVRDVLRLAGATTTGSVVLYGVVTVLPLAPGVPRSVLLIEWLMTTYLTAGMWITYRTMFEQIRHHRSGYNGSAKRVLIIGAGEAGNMLVREMWRFPTGYRPVGFVDDDPNKCGMNLHGLEVFGSTRELSAIVRAQYVEELIIAVPSATPSQLRDIVTRCEEMGLPLKVLPGIAEVLKGEVRLNHLREVQIEDLLGREPIELELPELAEDLRGQSVLITGAAGSIGSELARQVALYEPSTLVLLDQAETELYYLELELRDEHPDLELAPVVGDVVEPGVVKRVFHEYGPDRVFHAAAYKHVPMMEVNASEAVRNNVTGTWRVADAAGRHGTEKFVLVSTDKAVRPVSVMGASKRLAELAVLELQERYPGTAYGAVRFGNVLGSRGSVIPIFKRQLEQGRPLTVTHPEATRYFMTIPEAVQLILQTSLLEELRGHIAMLEMGEPVRIVDLARNLLRLAGLGHRNGDHLEFTGLRPGERLHEELVAPDEIAARTAIPKVRIVEHRTTLHGSVLEIVEQYDHPRTATTDTLADRLLGLVPSLDGGEPPRSGAVAATTGGFQAQN